MEEIPHMRCQSTVYYTIVKTTVSKNRNSEQCQLERNLMFPLSYMLTL